jgi:iron complex transport system permease protein
MGDAYATTSGLNVQRAKIGIVFSTSIMAGTITAFCGPIGFVGLAVPHIARMMFKSANHQLLIPACALLRCSGLRLV